jgi:lysozyme family protein
MATLPFTKDLADEYNHLFALAQPRPEHKFETSATADRIFDPFNIAQYQQVEAKIGVPAYVVGIIHSLEAEFNFNTHLHNGDPLSAQTVHVPRGRPPTGNPPFQWLDSAIDALTMHDLDKWTDWSVAGIAYVLERYNGFGYRLNHPHVKSPYLWSFTTIYSAGRYVADGKWSDIAVSKQCGGMAALRRIIDTAKAAIAVPLAPVDTGEVAITPAVSPEDGAAAPLAAPPAYPGHPVRMDARGPEVTGIQLRLAALGISTGGADGDFGGQTEAAVRLFQARAVDETNTPLEIDGIVGQKTWAALFGIATPQIATSAPPAGSLSAQALQTAATQVGVREVPLGSNRGPRVDQYLEAVEPGLRAAPWCMAFVYWCFGRAAANLNLANPVPRTAGVKRSWQMAQSLPGLTILPAAQAASDPSLVVPGMVFYIDTGPTTGHSGLVADVIGGTLVTIEGNTNEGGSANGIGVFQRSKRKINDISIGFVGFA